MNTKIDNSRKKAQKSQESKRKKCLATDAHRHTQTISRRWTQINANLWWQRCFSPL